MLSAHKTEKSTWQYSNAPTYSYATMTGALYMRPAVGMSSMRGCGEQVFPKALFNSLTKKLNQAYIIP